MSKPLEAEDGTQALKVWSENNQSVDLLLTDLMMPNGMSGQSLARELRSKRPELKVIYTTGYSAEAAAQGQDVELKEKVNFIQKPYRPEQ